MTLVSGYVGSPPRDSLWGVFATVRCFNHRVNVFRSNPVESLGFLHTRKYVSTISPTNHPRGADGPSGGAITPQSWGCFTPFRVWHSDCSTPGRRIEMIHKLTYWVADREDDSTAYSIRAKTRQEVMRTLASCGLPDSYGPIHKVTLEYTDAFDLMLCCRQSGGGE